MFRTFVFPQYRQTNKVKPFKFYYGITPSGKPFFYCRDIVPENHIYCVDKCDCAEQIEFYTRTTKTGQLTEADDYIYEPSNQLQVYHKYGNTFVPIFREGNLKLIDNLSQNSIFEPVSDAFPYNRPYYSGLDDSDSTTSHTSSNKSLSEQSYNSTSEDQDISVSEPITCSFKRGGIYSTI